MQLIEDNQRIIASCSFCSVFVVAVVLFVVGGDFGRRSLISPSQSSPPA